MWKLVLAFILFCLAMGLGRSEVRVNYINLYNFSEKDYVKIYKTARVIETILNSEEFKYRVIHHTYQGKLQYVDTKLSNEQVYELIMLGAEIAYMPEPNGEMDISLEYYYSSANTIGYTTAKSELIWLNRKYHDRYTEYEQAENLVHEWTHKLGFDHAKHWSESRDHSVPYAVGSIVTELAKIVKENPNSLTPVTNALYLK